MAYADGGGADGIKVFVSYSRADTAFALDMVAGLQACGFEAYIDQEDIAPGEPWEQRLSGLIEAADTVVYVLSPDSIVSHHCGWELEESLRLAKRLLPVVWRPVDDAQVPEALAQLNYTFFADKQSFAEGLRELSAALRVDVGWIREHTRLGAMARRWDARGRTDALLLRGDELDAAKTWAAAQPRGAPELTADQVDFIAASDAAHDAAERAARNRRRGLLVGVSAVAVAMAGLAGFAGWQWYKAAEATEFARQAWAEQQALNDTLFALNDELKAANLRLAADIGLRAPPTRNASLAVPGGWFPVAAKYSGAVAHVQRGRQITSAFLIDGALLHPDYAGEPLLFAPLMRDEDDLAAELARMDEMIAATNADGAAAAADFEAEGPFPRSFLEPGDEPDVGDGPPMAQSYVQDPPDFAALEPDGEPAPMAQTYLGAPDMGQTEGGTIAIFPTLDPDASIAVAPQPIWRTPIELAAEPAYFIYRLENAPPFGARPLAAEDISCADPFGDVEAGTRFALFGIDGAAQTLTLLVTEAYGFRDNGRFAYRHAPLKGTNGAPLFNLETGEVIGVHRGVQANRNLKEGRHAIAEPLLWLLNRAREGHSIDRGDEARTPPLCWEG
ncbi:MAG: toll/interleukin-1 receptor domain-containing protein [Pseudomonadota bacterium]